MSQGPFLVTPSPSPQSSAPDPSRFVTLYAPLLAFLLPLTVYIKTMARGLLWGDGIELSAVAATLGIAHPTGYPLFTLVGHGFTRIPVGSVYWRTTLFCAVCIAATAWVLYRILFSLSERLWGSSFPSPVSRALAALAGALTFAWARGPWSHAVQTEVYALELLLQVGVMAMGLRILCEGATAKRIAAIALLAGLGMSHHMLTLTVLPFLALVVLGGRKKEAGAGAGTGADTAAGVMPEPEPMPGAIPRGTPPGWRGRAVIALGGFVAGLLPWLYLPIRAAQSPALNWGNPSSWTQLRWHISGGEFREFRFLVESPGVPFTFDRYLGFFSQRLAELLRYLSGQLIAPADPNHPAWIALILLLIVVVAAGAWRCWTALRRFTLALGAALAIYLFFLVTYNIADISDYQLGFLGLLWPVLWIGGMEGVRFGASEWRRVGQEARARRFVWLTLALPIAAFLANYRACDRSDVEAPSRYARTLLAALPENAILLTAGDSDIYSAWYLQEVEGMRPDVLVYGSNFILNSWYADWFRGRDLRGREVAAEAGRPTTDVAFIETLSRLVIEPNLRRGFPIYTTLDIPALQRRHALEPVGLLLSREDYEAGVLRGEFPPPPALYQIR
jgi:hypothetical protein